MNTPHFCLACDLETELGWTRSKLHNMLRRVFDPNEPITAGQGSVTIFSEHVARKLALGAELNELGFSRTEIASILAKRNFFSKDAALLAVAPDGGCEVLVAGDDLAVSELIAIWQQPSSLRIVNLALIVAKVARAMDKRAAIVAHPSSGFDLDEANAHRYSTPEKRDAALAADKAAALTAPKRIARAGAH